MKNFSLNLFVALMITVFVVFAAEWDFFDVRYADGNSTATSDTLVATGVDTSNGFEIPRDLKGWLDRGKGEMPYILTYQFKGVETGTNSDSIAVEYEVEYSMDGTNWDSGTKVVLDTLTNTTSDTNATAILIVKDTLDYYVRYGRLIRTGLMAAGDTVVCSEKVARYFVE